MRRIVLCALLIAIAIVGLTAGRFGSGFLQAKAGNAQNPLDSPEIQKLLASYRRETTLLRPHRAEKPLGFARSKMGGVRQQ